MLHILHGVYYTLNRKSTQNYDALEHGRKLQVSRKVWIVNTMACAWLFRYFLFCWHVSFIWVCFFVLRYTKTSHCVVGCAHYSTYEQITFMPILDEDKVTAPWKLFTTLKKWTFYTASYYCSSNKTDSVVHQGSLYFRKGKTCWMRLQSLAK